MELASKRVIAAAIDAVFIACIDMAIMYFIWLTGISFGLLREDGDQLANIIYSSGLFFLDGLTSVAVPITGIYMFLADAVYEEPYLLAALFFLMCTAANWLYHSLFEATGDGGTPGKRIMGVRVVAEFRRRPTLSSASLRYLGRVLSVLALGIGFLPLFGPGRDRALPEALSGCRVEAD